MVGPPSRPPLVGRDTRHSHAAWRVVITHSVHRSCHTCPTAHYLRSRAPGFSSQLLQQGLCLLQVSGVKALGGPAVDLGEQLASVVVLPPVPRPPSTAPQFSFSPLRGAIPKRPHNTCCSVPHRHRF